MKTCGDYGGKTRAGNPCKNPAGFKTDHQGERKCYLHGGSAIGRPIKHGRYATVTSRRLQDKIQRHMEDPEPMNLLPELSLLRSLIDVFLERAEEHKDNMEAYNILLNTVDEIRKTADTIHKISCRELLTISEMQYLQVALADTLRRNIKDEDTLRRILKELRDSFQPSSAIRYDNNREGE